MGRPKKYADAAERQAAYRQRYEVITIRLERETVETLDRLAKYLDVPRTEVVASLVKFALLNRNWFLLGLFGKRLPHAHYDKQTRDLDAHMKGESDGNDEET